MSLHFSILLQITWMQVLLSKILSAHLTSIMSCLGGGAPGHLGTEHICEI